MTPAEGRSGVCGGRYNRLTEIVAEDVRQHAPGLTPTDKGGLPVPSLKSCRRELPTRTPGVYRDSVNGTYLVRLRAGGRNIKRRGLTSYAEACTLRARLTATPPRDTGGLPTFRAYYEAWAGTYQGRSGRGIRPETLAGYRENAERYAIPALGDLRLDRIDPVTLRRFVAGLHDHGLARNSVRLAFGPVKLMLAQAFEDGLLDRNPAAGIRIQTARVEPQREHSMTRDQLERLVAAVPGPAERLLVRFVAETGLRVSEAVAVRWCDVAGGRVDVGRRFRVGRMAEPKSRAGYRVVPMSPTLAKELWQLRKAAKWNADRDLIWPTATGTPRDYGNLYSRVLKPAATKAGVPWVGWHALRHTCATLLVTEHGLHPKQLQTWLGHESAEMSLSLYTHLTGDDLPTVEWARPGVHPVSTPPAEPATGAEETG